MLTEQEAMPVVVPGDKVQVAGAVRKSAVTWTVPVGVVAIPIVETSLTVAVHTEAWSINTGLEQVTLVEVWCGNVEGETTFRIVKPPLVM